MRPRIVLLADGKTKDAHLGNSRLLTRINGRPLLVRTIRQFGEWADVALLSSDPLVREAVKGQKHLFYVQAEDKSDRYFGVDMIRKGLTHAWNKRSIILFGDVVWTDEAVELVRKQQVDDWAVYGRSTNSEITGTRWAEYFAIEVNWGSREPAKRACDIVANHYMSKQWHRCTAWEWYYQMEQMSYDILNSRKVRTGPHWVEINDATDDIDTADDIERLRKIYEMA